MMSWPNVPTVAIVLFVLGSCLPQASDAAASDPENVVEVSADDLNSGKVVVIGRLGAPLKTMQTIRGTWHRPSIRAKDRGFLFHISHVNGKELSKPIIFYKALMDVRYPVASNKDEDDEKGPTPSEGESWEIRAYETGRFSGAPAEYDRELHLLGMQHPVWSREFQVTLHGIMQRPNANPKKAERNEEQEKKQARP